MSDLPRRGFLRGLTTLPLIGGGVTLIGNPTRAAEPVSPALLDSYDCWLFYERQRLQVERYQTNRTFVPVDNGGFGCHSQADAGAALPSTRAAIVPSAVGCDWREGVR